MKNLQAFLNPRRKEILKFVLSDAFVGEDGAPVEWEMRQLSAEESVELGKTYAHATPGEILGATVAQSLVFPNLRDAELIAALSKKAGRNLMKPLDALLQLVTDPEYAKLCATYMQFNELGQTFAEKVEEAKN